MVTYSTMLDHVAAYALANEGVSVRLAQYQLAKANVGINGLRAWADKHKLTLTPRPNGGWLVRAGKASGKSVKMDSIGF